MEELDLKELLKVFWEKKFLIIIIMLVFILVGILYSYLFVKPEYQSYTTLLLVKVEDSTGKGSTDAITQTDITVNQKLVSTYSELVRSKSVLREVINNLGLDKTYESLKNKVSVSFEKNTELIKITVKDEVPELARNIANEVATVFTKKITEIYKINNVNIIDKAEAEDTPYNVNHIKDILIFALIGLVFAAMVVLVLNMLNTTIRSATDIEKATKLLVLAEIPRYTLEERGGRN